MARRPRAVRHEPLCLSLSRTRVVSCPAHLPAPPSRPTSRGFLLQRARDLPVRRHRVLRRRPVRDVAPRVWLSAVHCRGVRGVDWRRGPHLQLHGRPKYVTNDVWCCGWVFAPEVRSGPHAPRAWRTPHPSPGARARSSKLAGFRPHGCSSPWVVDIPQSPTKLPPLTYTLPHTLPPVHAHTPLSSYTPSPHTHIAPPPPCVPHNPIATHTPTQVHQTPGADKQTYSTF